MGFPIGVAVFVGSSACLLDLTDGQSPNVTTTLLAHQVLQPRYRLTVMITCLQCVEAFVSQVNKCLNFVVIKLHIIILKQQSLPPEAR